MNSRAAVVGAFILGALALVVAGILFFGGMWLFATTTRVVVFFSEPVTGLDVGAPVTFHGVRIGSVQSISIRFNADAKTARIPVYLELEPSQLILEGSKFTGRAGLTSATRPSASDYEDMVRAGLRAQLSLQSFVTGQLRVDLDFRPDTPARLSGTIADVPEIPAVSSELSHLWSELSKLPLRELADSAQKAFASVARLSDHLDTRLDPLIDSVQHTADTATHTLQTADAFVRQLQVEASTALHDLRDLLVDARGQVNARGGELGRTIATADRAIRQAETFLESLNSLVEPRSAFRGDLEATMRDLAASASSLRGFAGTVERNPNALIMGRTSR
jgi:paraquat-inducible protein B